MFGQHENHFSLSNGSAFLCVALFFVTICFDLVSIAAPQDASQEKLRKLLSASVSQWLKDTTETQRHGDTEKIVPIAM